MMYITACAHCKRLKTPGTETWLNLFLRPDNRLDREGMVSHSICQECLRTNPLYASVKDGILARQKERKEEALT